MIYYPTKMLKNRSTLKIMFWGAAEEVGKTEGFTSGTVEILFAYYPSGSRGTLGCFLGDFLGLFFFFANSGARKQEIVTFREVYHFCSLSCIVFPFGYLCCPSSFLQLSLHFKEQPTRCLFGEYENNTWRPLGKANVPPLRGELYFRD